MSVSSTSLPPIQAQKLKLDGRHAEGRGLDVDVSTVIEWIRHGRQEFAIWCAVAPCDRINGFDESRNSLLHWAAFRGHTDFVLQLMQRGASVDATNINGATPLHCAAIGGDRGCVDALLRFGADPAMRNDQGKTFVDICRIKGHTHLETALLQHVAKARSADPSGGLGLVETMELDATSLPRRAVGKPQTHMERRSTSTSGTVGGVSDSSSVTEPPTLLHDTDVTNGGVKQPSGHCAVCDVNTTAIWYCAECRQKGEPEMFCDVCWAAEHSSRKTRHHTKVPLLLATDDNPSTGLVALHQQLLAILQPRRVKPNVTNSTTQTKPPHPHNTGVQTADDHRSPFFSDAMLELQDVREQLEAEVFHSQSMIDTVRLQLLESVELKHRAEIETLFWRRLAAIRRPPQVVLIVTHQPPQQQQQQQNNSNNEEERPEDIYRGVPVVRVAERVHKSRSSAFDSSPKLRRNATCNQGVQASRPSNAAVSTQTDEQPPPKVSTGRGFNPRYPPDAVLVVHGEKHLPGQSQMLLVQWRNGAESWIPAVEVAHCDVVVAYMSKYDRTGLYSAEGLSGAFAGSPLNDEERQEVIRQLAGLKRIATTGGGSRDSPKQGGGSAFQLMMAPVDEVLPLPPRGRGGATGGGGDVAQPLDADGEEYSSVPPEEGPVALVRPDSDERILRFYEEKLRVFEARHNQAKKARDEAQDRVKRLGEKQQMLDCKKRAQLHAEYEARVPQLIEQQPEVNHPLYRTNERHAALVLQKIHEEMSNNTSSSVGSEPPAVASTSKKDSSGVDLSDAARYKSSSASDSHATVEPPVARDAATNPHSTPEPTPSPHDHHRPAPDPMMSKEQQPSSFEQKLNRILYEQYFYHRVLDPGKPTVK